MIPAEGLELVEKSALEEVLDELKHASNLLHTEHENRFPKQVCPISWCHRYNKILAKYGR